MERVEPVHPETNSVMGPGSSQCHHWPRWSSHRPQEFERRQEARRRCANGDQEVALRPATLGGEPIETETIVSIDFELH